MKKVIKKNYKFILGIVIGLIWSSGIAYAATILFDSDEVSYDNTTSGLSATNVQSALDELYVESTSYQLFESRVSTLASQVYPVGSVYISTTKSTEAQVKALFGGTWEAISEGRVLIGAGTGTDELGNSMTFSAGSTGGSSTAGNSSSTQTITNPLGEYTHQLNVKELAYHAHRMENQVDNGSAGSAIRVGSGSSYIRYFTDDSRGTYGEGGDYYHNNIQPYLVVYMYKRTA